MPAFYLPVFRVFATSLFFAPLGVAWGQLPTITGITPLPNASAVTRTSAIIVTFSQPLTATSTSALQVFSAQRGGRRTVLTPPAVNGTTLSFQPTYPFASGETVRYTVSRAATGTGGSLVQAHVGQFTAAVGGTGTGIYIPGATPLIARSPHGVATGDVDGDGDLDLLIANAETGTVSVRLNEGLGSFSGTQEVNVGNGPYGVLLTDVDGDGDLDLLASNVMGSFPIGSSVSVRLNDGRGTFTSGQEVAVGRTPYTIAIGDVDGDGDLDLLTANYESNTVSVRVNDGFGTFSGTQNLSVSEGPYSVAVGDVDSDGDLDLLVSAYNRGSGVVNVCLNNGSGTFARSVQEVPVGDRPWHVVLADLDDDGDLDLLAANNGVGTVSVRVNDGRGTFGGGQEVLVGLDPFSMAIGDIDHDGDLDMVTPSYMGNSVHVRLNNGAGSFSGSQSIPVGGQPWGVVLGDVDGDGDLDLLTANSGSNTVSVHLNTSPVLAVTAGRQAAPFTLFPNPAHGGKVTVSHLLPYTSCTVLDLLGRVACTAASDANGTAQLTVPTGFYLVRSNGQVRHLIVK